VQHALHLQQRHIILEIGIARYFPIQRVDVNFINHCSFTFFFPNECGAVFDDGVVFAICDVWEGSVKKYIPEEVTPNGREH